MLVYLAFTGWQDPLYRLQFCWERNGGENKKMDENASPTQDTGPVTVLTIHLNRNKKWRRWRWTVRLTPPAPFLDTPSAPLLIPYAISPLSALHPLHPLPFSYLSLARCGCSSALHWISFGESIRISPCLVAAAAAFFLCDVGGIYTCQLMLKKCLHNTIAWRRARGGVAQCPAWGYCRTRVQRKKEKYIQKKKRRGIIRRTRLFSLQNMFPN